MRSMVKGMTCKMSVVSKETNWVSRKTSVGAMIIMRPYGVNVMARRAISTMGASIKSDTIGGRGLEL